MRHESPREETAPPHDKHAGHSVTMFRTRFSDIPAFDAPTRVWGHKLQQALARGRR